MKNVVQLCYAPVSNRLYALCDDGSIFFRVETKLDSPWIKDGRTIEEPIIPVEVADEIPPQPELPLKPEQETGVIGMLGEAPKSNAPDKNPSFLAPGTVPVVSPASNASMPIIPQRV